MTEDQFRQQLQVEGYADIQFKDYPPDNDGLMHTHDEAVKLLVIRGEFRLAQADSVVAYQPGEVCELAAGIAHVERSGPAGATILLGKR